MLPVRLPRATRALRACGRAACLPALLLHAYQYALSSWCGVVWAEGGKEATGVQVAHSPICSPRAHTSRIQAGAASNGPTARARSVLTWVAAPAGLLAAVGALWGAPAAALGVAQAAVAILLLEDVNYVEHYGLTRARAPSGMCAPPCPGMRAPPCPGMRAPPWARPRAASPGRAGGRRRRGASPGRWRGEVGAWAEGGVALGVPGL